MAEEKIEQFEFKVKITIGHCVELIQETIAQCTTSGIISGACASEN